MIMFFAAIFTDCGSLIECERVSERDLNVTNPNFLISLITGVHLLPPYTIRLLLPSKERSSLIRFSSFDLRVCCAALISSSPQATPSLLSSMELLLSGII
ncbi:hypothetical protein HN873_067465 [Arachis hypogaea]